MQCGISNSNQAYEGYRLLKKISWWINKRPSNIKTFSEKVLDKITKEKPGLLLTTGVSPLELKTVKKLKAQVNTLINFSTDDPWNPAHRAEWFLRTLSEYDHVFSTRTANLEEFVALGARASHLPFGYDPELYFPDDGGLMPDVRRNEEAKVFLAGGGDVDR
ncbi:hypothetical protein EBX31_07365, partial [bacterium]|nr:hypothetical protein [bacterium]